MRIYLESYGCTLQKSESSLYVNRLLSEGNKLVDSPEEADLSVVGTCIVIKKTEDKMLKRIEALSQKSKVKVIGCLAPTGGDAISGENIEVAGTSEFRKFYNGTLEDVDVVSPSIWEGIPINQGCTGSCNFCISRIARGRLVSRKPEKIVSQIRLQLGRGIREVKITSLDTAAYGRDIGLTLDMLVDNILDIEGYFRLRIGMMEPKNTADIQGKLFSLMRDPRVYKFLHLPVQSGDNRVLDSMNREYQAETFMEISKNFQAVFPDGLLSTDIVVGYHSDDEESFQKTYDLMEKTRPGIMNITKFSPRPYTKDFNSRLPPSNKIKRWSSELTDLHHRILNEKLSSRIGKTEDAMATEKGKNGTTVLRDGNYFPVVVRGTIPMYSEVSVEIVDTGSTFLIGKIVS